MMVVEILRQDRLMTRSLTFVGFVYSCYNKQPAAKKRDKYDGPDDDGDGNDDSS